jgi:hypothetical protein
MCFCGPSQAELDAEQARYIHTHLPSYETQRHKQTFVMTYEEQDRAKWAAAEAEKLRRRKQYEHSLARPKPTHHRDRNGYWVANTNEHQMAPFASVRRKPVNSGR